MWINTNWLDASEEANSDISDCLAGPSQPKSRKLLLVPSNHARPSGDLMLVDFSHWQFHII